MFNGADAVTETKTWTSLSIAAELAHEVPMQEFPADATLLDGIEAVAKRDHLAKAGEVGANPVIGRLHVFGGGDAGRSRRREAVAQDLLRVR